MNLLYHNLILIIANVNENLLADSFLQDEQSNEYYISFKKSVK